LLKNKHLNLLLIFVYAAMTVLLLWFSLKFLIPWLSPFILAFITAGLIEPIVSAVSEKAHIRRGFVSVLCTIILLLSIIGIVAFLSLRAFSEAVSFLKELPALLINIPSAASSFENTISNYISSMPQQVQEYLTQAINGISSAISSLPSVLTEKLFGIASSVISSMPKIVLFIVTYSIGVLFASIGYKDIKSFILRQIPEKFKIKAVKIKSDMISTFGKWLKAELSLMGITFLELCLGFALIKIEYAALLALFVSIIDALPVFGTGTVLIPWSIFEFISGNQEKAISLIVMYCIITLVRSFMEPKLIGKQVGLSPIVTLITIYIGFSCAGIWGMILFPMAMIIVKQLNDSGYIRLWR